MEQGYCPVYGYGPPCSCCMWSLHDTDKEAVMCSVAHLASSVQSDGRQLVYLTMKDKFGGA